MNTDTKISDAKILLDAARKRLAFVKTTYFEMMIARQRGIAMTKVHEINARENRYADAYDEVTKLDIAYRTVKAEHAR